MTREQQIDTQLAEISIAYSAVQAKISSHRDYVAGEIGLERERDYNGRRRFVETPEEVVALAQEKLEDETFIGYRRSSTERYLVKLVEELEKARALRQQAKPLEDTYSQERWSRFFLVQNNNGHIHSSMGCHTCKMTTSFSWLPTVSGLTEKDAVEEFGAILCTACFPSAPVEWTNGISKAEQAAKDEREAAKLEREAAKLAKGITTPDGSPLLDNYGHTIKTEVTARREMGGALENALYYPNSEEKYVPYAQRLAEAIAAKTGESVEALLEDSRKKAQKRYNKNVARSY